MLPSEILIEILTRTDCAKTIAACRLVNRFMRSLVDEHPLVWDTVVGNFRDILRPEVMMSSRGWTPYDLVRYFYGWKKLPGMLKKDDHSSLTSFSKPPNITWDNWLALKTSAPMDILAWIPVNKADSLRDLWDLGDGNKAAMFRLKGSNHVFDSTGRSAKVPSNGMSLSPIQGSYFCMSDNTLYEYDRKQELVVERIPKINEFIDPPVTNIVPRYGYGNALIISRNEYHDDILHNCLYAIDMASLKTTWSHVTQLDDPQVIVDDLHVTLIRSNDWKDTVSVEVEVLDVQTGEVVQEITFFDRMKRLIPQGGDGYSTSSWDFQYLSKLASFSIDTHHVDEQDKKGPPYLEIVTAALRTACILPEEDDDDDYNFDDYDLDSEDKENQADEQNEEQHEAQELDEESQYDEEQEDEEEVQEQAPVTKLATRAYELHLLPKTNNVEYDLHNVVSNVLISNGFFADPISEAPGDYVIRVYDPISSTMSKFMIPPVGKDTQKWPAFVAVYREKQSGGIHAIQVNNIPNFPL